MRSSSRFIRVSSSPTEAPLRIPSSPPAAQRLRELSRILQLVDMQSLLQARLNTRRKQRVSKRRKVDYGGKWGPQNDLSLICAGASEQARRSISTKFRNTQSRPVRDSRNP
jgi:hypothetical protein